MGNSSKEHVVDGEKSQRLLQEPLATIFAQLQTDGRGLADEEAELRLHLYGPNEPIKRDKTNAAVQFLRLFLNPLVLILLIASIISCIFGDVISAGIIIVIVLLSNSLNFLQTYRSQSAVEKLRMGVTSTATVLRDGKWREIQRQKLVPGDIIRVDAGDMIPADARLLEVTHLHVQQAALTGESLPVEKFADDIPLEQKDGTDYTNCVFLGSSVASGYGRAIITSTGLNTAFGNIALRLTQHPPETAFERGTRQFGMLITQIVFFLVIFIFIIGIIARHPPFETILFAIALAVGLTPEFLPMITTVTLGQGAMRMAKRKVIVKHLESIQNFGSIDVLCSDKTGTLTSGEIHLNAALDVRSQSSEEVFLLSYLNSFFESGFKSPLDQAILEHQELTVSGYSKVGEIPFDFERRRLSVVIRKDASTMLISKGAPESILSVCTSYQLHGDICPLGEQERETFEASYQALHEQGYRVLSVAYKDVMAQPRYTTSSEQQMVLVGFLTFADVPKVDVADVLVAMKRDGIQVKILTGDNERVTRHVCSQVGLESEAVVLGSEVDAMTDPALEQVVAQTTIFARVSPAQKNRIIHALKARGRVVGYMGDGINDAPSLHTADVGISVASAVDVAKDAASIILLEPGLDVLHQGIIEGRKAFGNVMKYLLMGTSSNFGNMFSMAGAYVFLPFLPMLATQILLNNFLYDLAQITIPTDSVDTDFIRKPHHWDITLIRNFMIFIGPLSSIFDFLTFFLMLHVFHASEELFHTGWFVESLATQTLVLFIIRTTGNPLKSRPSLPLTVTTLTVVVIGLVLPFSPLASLLGFIPLPGLYFLFLLLMIVTYLLLVQYVKSRLMKKFIF